MNLYNLKAYKVIEEKYIKEVDSKAFLLEHIKTKAKVVVLSNNDKNKTFSISFRTPPKDDTGVPHIIEHSVLCGSKAFPSKEPFVELMKASLNTFLNAMTFPDKTMYPVSSCNDKDFQNLVNVYLDAVFYPNMYINDKIFKQEGWHYELDKEDGNLTYNGVVYNEMKGAFSSPEQVLMREVLHVMYKDNCYTYESGGNPEFIPTLTYKDFLDFHSKYYHPSNSYIYLYGDADFEEKLIWIDEEYLSKFDYKEIDSKINKQKDFEKPINHYVEYPIGTDSKIEGKTFISKNYLMGECDDMLLWLTLTILTYTLFDAPGAKVKQALYDANICKEVVAMYDASIIQPLFTLYISGTDKDKENEFCKIVDETLQKCVEEGIDKKALAAAINIYEFKYRESDFGSDPKGLVYGMNIMETWLYDCNPFIKLETDFLFTKLKELINTNYFEEVVSKYFINNNNNGIVIASPNTSLGVINDAKVQKELSDYKSSLDKEQIMKIIEETKDLKEYQASPSNKEDLDKIPYLTRDDLMMELDEINNKEFIIDDVKIVHHNYVTNNIGYLNILFDTSDLSEEYLPYLGILVSILGKVDTENYTYPEINIEKNLNSGGIRFDFYQTQKGDKLYLNCDSSTLYEKASFAYEMICEIITKSKFTDKKRIREILLELKNRKENNIVSSGHIYSYTRALSYIEKSMYIIDSISGISFYKKLDEIINNFDEEFDNMTNKLIELSKAIFVKKNMLISYTGTDDGFNIMKEYVKPFTEKLFEDTITLPKINFTKALLNEGIKTSSNVQYVSRVGNFVNNGYKYSGKVLVLKNILGTEYLWVKGRVLGGAYGCMCFFRRNGDTAFISYRDPNLKETNNIYENVIEYIKEFNSSEDDMTKYIIGTVGGLIFPRTPRMKGSYALSSYLNGLTIEDYKKELQEVINCKDSDIRELYDLVKSVLEDNALCVIGNENKIETEKDIFNNIYSLIL